MTRRSLRVRLWIAAALSIGVALIIAGFGLVALFERHVERRIGDELSSRLNQLADALVVDANGNLVVDPAPSDPRFRQPLSGLYWQIDRTGDGAQRRAGLLRSRSLWDAVIALQADSLEPGAVHTHRLPGPAGQRLLVRERGVSVRVAGNTVSLRLMVGIDLAELIAARRAFATDMLPYLALIALLLGLATLVQVRAGLAPLESVRRGVGAIRSGQTPRLSGDYPDEVMPLVGEVNALLAAREQAVERARAWTADLAHGLKTPLSALAADAQRLREQGNPLLAADLDQLAEGMRRRVDRELIRARVRSSAGIREARADSVEAIRRLLRTLQRTPEGGRIAWQLEAPRAAFAALMPDDLLELLGNLLENAAKWARNRVVVQVHADAHIRIRIADDGPGVPVNELPRLGERGLRLDQRKEGSGIGLAIARDVVDAYAGRLDFANAAEGGLEVQVRLPLAP